MSTSLAISSKLKRLYAHWRQVRELPLTPNWRQQQGYGANAYT